MSEKNISSEHNARESYSIEAIGSNRLIAAVWSRQTFLFVAKMFPSLGKMFLLSPVHVTTRKSLGLMIRKLSVTESQRSAQFRGTFSRRKPSVASANWAQVA